MSSLSSPHVLLLGASGMLGTYVHDYLTTHNVLVTLITRKEFDAEHDDVSKLNPYFISVNYVVNCMGIIRQRNATPSVFIKVNSVFPRLLAMYLSLQHPSVRFIHISTDCVFDTCPLGSGFVESDSCVADVDLYGQSKYCGEPPEAMTLRTSIIGEERNNKLSLIEFVKDPSRSECNGYDTHWWNGVTCRQLASILHYIVTTGVTWRGVRHVFSPDTLTKYELVKAINEVFQCGKVIHQTNPLPVCHRVLGTLYPEFVQQFHIPTIRQQLVDLRSTDDLCSIEEKEGLNDAVSAAKKKCTNVSNKSVS